jgi:precorrin-3B synthase
MSAVASPSVKGWCPGALRPMMSGDGLIVRVRPRLARLSRRQALGLCKVALAFGSGILDLTSRANLQIRGVREDRHQALLSDLASLDLLDIDPVIEARRNLLCTPLWHEGDLTHRLHAAIVEALPTMPALPAKMGIAIDTGPAPMLGSLSADFRFETSISGHLMLRADGARNGHVIAEQDAVPALLEMMTWFVETGGPVSKRMAVHVGRAKLPGRWTTHASAASAPPIVPGLVSIGRAYGAAFGQIDAEDLKSHIKESQATALRVTPWRVFVLEGGRACDPHDFITEADDPLMTIHACPGKPYCPSASVETRALARQLAPHTKLSLHISGCSKGCAHPATAALTLVGRGGAYDLVRGDAPWAAPDRTGLAATDLPFVLRSSPDT